MSYAVIHMQKVKGNGVTGMQIHNQRERESETNPDIKKDQSHLNYDLENDGPIDYHERIKGLIDERVDQSQRKVRKDAVKVASFLVSSDKDFFDRIGEREEKRYFETARDFIADRYGKENIAYAVVHKDEKTPHMHLGFVPITEDNRLSAKDFFGKKQQLHQLQDDFHAHMMENGFDLERGKSSDKKHLETNQFKIKTAQEKINGLETELQQKQQEKDEIETSIEKIQTELQDLSASVDHSKQVDEVEFKEKKRLRGPQTVKLARSDFDRMRSLAKASEALKIENKGIYGRNVQLEKKNSNLEKQNHKLNKDNQALQKENQSLKQENKFLQRTIEQFKVRFKDQVQELGRKIGFIKADTLDRMGMKMPKKHFSEKDEVEGGMLFLKKREQNKQNEKQNEKQDEHELE